MLCNKKAHVNLNCVSIKAKANKNFLDMRKKLPRLILVDRRFTKKKWKEMQNYKKVNVHIIVM